jgi:hypothetical protein
LLIEHFTESFYQQVQPFGSHIRDRFIEHASLAKQRMDALSHGIGSEQAIIVKALSDRPSNVNKAVANALIRNKDTVAG